MKLKQLLKAHFDTNGPTAMGRGVTDYVLTPELLNVYKEELSQCVEFGGSNINIIETVKSGKPKRVLQGHDEEGIPMYGMEFETLAPSGDQIITVKLGPNTKFAPNIELYSVSLTPEVFDPADIFKTKLDTVQFTPLTYDPELNKPVKRMIVTFSPEVAQGLAIKQLRQEMREIDNQQEKPEFVINSENSEDELKNKASEVKDIMETVSNDELKSKIKEEEEKYIQNLIEKIKTCMTSTPGENQIPSRRGILLRITKNSLVDNDTQVISQEDITVILK